MTTATLRLLFAGALAMLSLMAALAIALVGIAGNMDVQDIVILSGPFVAVTTASVGFFMGHTNGVSAIQEAVARDREGR